MRKVFKWLAFLLYQAYYRRATALFASGLFKESLKDFRAVVKCAPHDADAKLKLSEAEKVVRIKAMSDALSYEEVAVSKLDSITLDPQSVETSYTGAIWHPDEPISEAFVKDMLARFKSQKSVHVQFVYRVMPFPFQGVDYVNLDIAGIQKNISKSAVLGAHSSSRW